MSFAAERVSVCTQIRQKRIVIALHYDASCPVQSYEVEGRLNRIRTDMSAVRDAFVTALSVFEPVEQSEQFELMIRKTASA
ncbi:MAG: hypothetical protein PHH01_03880 [Patescibacteria group bacterium]|nr:hypothetical protein [Patescibacteria group bacterium]